jgi:radical SAM protein with 4Fe4S-binding SPASM domain
VNNDGEAHRRELKGYGRSINRWLKLQGFPHDGRFQLLCHNCNIAKGCYGGCPHQGTVPGRRQGTKPWYG